MNLVLLAILAAPTVTLPQLPEGNCFSGGFEQRRSLPSLQQPLVLRGHIKVIRDGGLEWNVTHPYNYGLVISGNRISETLPDGSQREIEASRAPWLAGVQRLFNALLAGDESAIRDWFSVAEVTEIEQGQRVALIPAGDVIGNAITGMAVEYDQQLRFIEINERGGGKSELRFATLSPCEAQEAAQ